MGEGVASLALIVLATCVLIVGAVILFAKRGQALSLDIKGFGISVNLKRDAEIKEN